MPAATKPASPLAALLATVSPKGRLLILGAMLGGGALAWLDHRIDAHLAPVVAAVDGVASDVRDLSHAVQTRDATVDARIDSQDVQIAGIRATIDADERQPTFAGHGP